MPNAKVIQLPRRLEWRRVDCYVAKVPKTGMHGRVEVEVDGKGRWWAFDKQFCIGSGQCDGVEDGTTKAKETFERCLVVTPK